jgi:outer membrane protein assembly factor BamB
MRARSQAAGSRSVTSHGGFDVLLLKVDNTGSVAWCVAFGGAGADTGLALAVGLTRSSSAEGNTSTQVLYAGGQFRDTATFGDRVLTAEAVADGFVLKVNPTTGGVLWALRVGGAGGADQVDALAVGLNNTLTAMGTFSGSLSVPGIPPLQSDGDASDVFVLRVRAHLPPVT